MENNFYEEELTKIQNEKANENPKRKIRCKKRVTRVALLASLAALLALVTTLGSCSKTNKNKGEVAIATPTPKPIVKIEDLGFKTEDIITIEGNEFGEVTGDINANEIVEKDGNLYKDKDAANKSDKVGTTVTDDKKGTLTVKPNGEVVEKDKGYEVKDETGKVISTGSNTSGVPEGYKKDENLDKVVKEEQVDKFVKVDANYYDKKGNLVWEKGEVVLKETLEKIKKDSNLTTIAPTATATAKPTATAAPTSTTKPTATPTATATAKPTATPTATATAKPTATPTAKVDSLGGVVNKNGTYTIYGTTYMDKATFEAFIIDENSTQNFGFYNGVVYPVEVIKEMTKSNTK